MARKKAKVLKAWGLITHRGTLLPLTGRSKSWMKDNYEPPHKVVRVEIRVAK